MAEGMLVVDRNAQVDRVNQAFRTLYGCPTDRAFSGHPVTGYHPDALVLANALTTPAARRWIATEMTPFDGDVRVVSLSVASLDSHNAAASYGAVILVQDITECKRNEERLNYLALYD